MYGLLDSYEIYVAIPRTKQRLLQRITQTGPAMSEVKQQPQNQNSLKQMDEP